MNLKTVSISNTSEFRNLLNNSNKKEEVKELIVNENCCNDMKDDLEIVYKGFDVEYSNPELFNDVKKVDCYNYYSYNNFSINSFF